MPFDTRLLCIANWKANLTPRQECRLASRIAGTLSKPLAHVEPIVCPSFLSLSSISGLKSLRRANIGLGSQDCFWESHGAATGEVTSSSLHEEGVGYVILGHSERRELLGETDAMISKKLTHVVSTQKSHMLTPILCIGETLVQRTKGRTNEIILKQLENAFSDIKLQPYHRIIVAYEPVWAISTHKAASATTCTPEDCVQAREVIEGFFKSRYAKKNTRTFLRIIYGGSVDIKNVRSYITQGHMDGVLVGSASLHSDQFCAMVQALNTLI